MSEGTKIQWADDTANFWRGCTKVSPGCAHCYAEKNIGVKMHGIQWGKGAARVRSASIEAQVRSWNRRPWVCDVCGATKNIFPPPSCCGVESYHRRRIFSLSLGDWLDEGVPIEWLAGMLQTIQECPNLDFLLLTKRPENFIDRMRPLMNSLRSNVSAFVRTPMIDWMEEWNVGKAPSNVWLGVSVENQEMADLRIPQLAKIPAKLYFLSVEPLIERTHLRLGINTHVDWVIVGGESGPKARPCHTDWIRSIVEQCKTAGKACFVKQLGANARGANMSWDADAAPLQLADKKGGNIDEWPQDLRVREFPKISS